MNLSFHTFAEELMLIKLAKRDPEDKPTMKKFLRGALVYGPAVGVGWGLGHLANKKILPRILKGSTPKQRMIASGVIGGLGGILSSRAFDVLTKEKK